MFTHVISRTYRDSSGVSITAQESVTGDSEFNFDGSIAVATRVEVDYAVTRANLKSLSLYCADAVTVYAEKATALAVVDTINASGGDAQIEITSHGLAVNDIIRVTGIGGSTNLNGVWFVKTVVDANHIKISATSGGSAVQGNDATYTSGGSVYYQLRIDIASPQNLLWSVAKDGLSKCPFTTDIGKLFVTNANADAVTFKVRSLADQTP